MSIWRLLTSLAGLGTTIILTTHYVKVTVYITSLLQDPEAEFLDVIGTKVLRVFLLANYSHIC